MLERSIGSVIGGYRIDDVVGRGGMGVVYRATDVVLERTVALKLVAPELAQDRRFRERFSRELRYVASIDHPNVIPVHHAGDEEGVLFIAMRFVPGIDLRTLVARDGAVEPGRAVDIISQVAAALDAAHARGVVHRDVKPANVLIEDRAGRDHIFLTDFGLSKHTTSAGGLTAPGEFVGTVDYVAPEQIRGESVGERADVYALGCVLFHALTGQAPFARDSEAAKLWAHMYEPPPGVTELGPVPSAFDGVIARAMEKRSEDRYASAGELGRAAIVALMSSRPGRRESAEWTDPDATAVSGVADPFAGAEPRLSAAPPSAEPPSAPSAEPPSAPSASQPPAPSASQPPAPSASQPPAPSPAPPSLPASTPPEDRVAASEPATVGDAPQPAPPAPEAPAAPAEPAQPASPAPEAPEAPAEPAQPAEPRPAATRPSAIVVGAIVALVVLAGAAAFILLGGGGGSGDGAPRVAATIGVGAEPVDVAVIQDAVWVANSGDGTLTRIDAGSEDTARVRAGSHPSAVAIGEGALWVADALNRLDRLDPRTGRPLNAPRRLSTDPYDVAVGGGAVWLPNGLRDTVTRLDARTRRVTGPPIEVGQAPASIAVGEGAAWVVNSDSGSVSRLEATTGQPLGGPIKVGEGPTAVAVGAGSVWVANTDSNTVSRIDARSGSVVGSPIPVGQAPSALAIGEGAVWVANSGSDSVTRIDPRTARVIGEPIAVGKSPAAVTVGGGSVWVANSRSNDVSRIEP